MTSGQLSNITKMKKWREKNPRVTLNLPKELYDGIKQAAHENQMTILEFVETLFKRWEDEHS